MEQRMAELETNRDLYCFMADLVRRRAESGTTLQAYLENLRRLACRMGDRDALPLSDFAELLQAAFEPELPRIEPCASATDAHLAWEQRITEQIRDLSEMKEAGAIDNEYRYFGVDAPRGGCWYNFDPCSYLECAAAGSFGGWQEGDDTGRSYVPGPVAVLDASGAVTSMAPSDIDAPVVELPEITWEAFIDFLNAGQWYE